MVKSNKTKITDYKIDRELTDYYTVEPQEIVIDIPDSRPPWDLYFAKIVEQVALRSTCTRRQIGAAVVNERHQIVSTGFNGVVRNAVHCMESGCVKDEKEIKSGTGHEICPAVHAETNALLQAGKESEGCTIYVNAFPCKICARNIVNAGIARVVVSGEYSDEEGLNILGSVGIDVTNIKESNSKGFKV